MITPNPVQSTIADGVPGAWHLLSSAGRQTPRESYHEVEVLGRSDQSLPTASVENPAQSRGGRLHLAKGFLG